MGRIFASVLAGVLLVSAGCTRKADTSSVKLALPERLGKVGALAETAPYMHLVINVSGPGISPTITYDWDRRVCEHLPVCAPPSSIEIPEVPNGTGRLVQVLAITGWDENMGTFWYGDKGTTVNGATTVDILITPYGGNATISNGQISGRYFKNVMDSLGNPTIATPTGTIITRIPAPDPLKPGVIINQSEMFAGWFSVFGLGEIGLTYELAGYGNMFGTQTVALNTFAAPNTIKVVAPSSVRTWDGSVDSAQTAFIGRFGDGALSIPANSLNVCQAGAYTYKYKIMDTPFAPMDFPSDMSVTGSVSVCGGTPYENHITFRPEAHDQRGIERAGGFEGPFMGWVANGRFDFLHVHGGVTIDWQYLPGIDATIVDGVKIWIRENTSSNYERRDYETSGGGVDCANLGARGFTALNGGNLIPFPTSEHVQDLSAYSSANLIVCPVKLGRNYTSAVDTRIGSEFEGSMPATGIAIVGPARIGNHASSANAPCTPYRVEGRSGTKKAWFDGSSISISSGNANVQFYSDPMCSSPFGASTNTGGDSFTFFAQSTFPSTLPASVTFAAAYKGAVGNLAVIPTALPGAINGIYKLRIGATNIRAFQCYEAAIEKWHDGTPAMMANFFTGPSLIPPADFVFYPDSGGGGDDGCQGSPYVGSISMPSSELVQRLRFRYVGSAATGAITLAVGVTSPALTISQPGPLARMSMWAPWEIEQGSCQSISLVGQDREGNMVGLPDPATFTLYDFLGTGGFYTDDTCSSGTSTIDFVAGEVAKTVYYKPTVAGATAMFGANDGGSPALIGVGSSQTTTATANYIAYQYPGVTFNFTTGAYSGSPMNQLSGGSITISFYAVKYDHSVDTGYNQPMNVGDLYLDGLSVVTIMGGGFVNGQMNVIFSITGAPASTVYVNGLNAPKSGGMGGWNLQYPLPAWINLDP